MNNSGIEYTFKHAPESAKLSLQGITESGV